MNCFRTIVVAVSAGALIACTMSPARYAQREAPTCEPGTQPAVVGMGSLRTPIWSCLKSCRPGREYVTDALGDGDLRDRRYEPSCTNACEPGSMRNGYARLGNDEKGPTGFCLLLPTPAR